MYKSLADFIEKLERADELIRIGAPVSSELEIAEITDRMVKSEGGGIHTGIVCFGTIWSVQ